MEKLEFKVTKRLRLSWFDARVLVTALYVAKDKYLQDASTRVGTDRKRDKDMATLIEALTREIEESHEIVLEHRAWRNV